VHQCQMIWFVIIQKGGDFEEDLLLTWLSFDDNNITSQKEEIFWRLKLKNDVKDLDFIVIHFVSVTLIL